MQNEFTRTIDLTKSDIIDHLFVIEATEEERSKLSARFDLLSLSYLSANILLTIDPNHKNCYFLKGTLKALCEQPCIATLKPVKEKIKEDFSVWIRPISYEKEDQENEELNPYDDIDYHVNDKIDIGEILSQYLSINLNPYPRYHDEHKDTSQQPLNQK